MPAFHGATPILQVADLARSLRFYRDLLGFELTYRFPEDGDPVFVSLEVPGGTVGLAAGDGPVESASTAIFAYTDDVDAAFAALRAAGATVVAEPADQPWGERLASVADPDGYTVHIAAADNAGAPG
jgi:lactoylglutathione lyase